MPAVKLAREEKVTCVDNMALFVLQVCLLTHRGTGVTVVSAVGQLAKSLSEDWGFQQVYLRLRELGAVL